MGAGVPHTRSAPRPPSARVGGNLLLLLLATASSHVAQATVWNIEEHGAVAGSGSPSVAWVRTLLGRHGFLVRPPGHRGLPTTSTHLIDAASSVAAAAFAHLAAAASPCAQRRVSRCRACPLPACREPRPHADV